MALESFKPVIPAIKQLHTYNLDIWPPGLDAYIIK